MVASDDDSASASLFTLLDLVDLTETLALVGNLELLCKVVVANTTGEHHRIGRQNVLKRMRCFSNQLFATITAAPRAAFWEAPPAT